MTQLLGISCSIVAVLVLHTQDFKSNFWGFVDPKEQEKVGFISIEFSSVLPYLACSMELTWRCTYM